MRSFVTASSRSSFNMRSGQHKSSVHERIRRPSPVVVRERLGVTWAGDTPAEVERLGPLRTMNSVARRADQRSTRACARRDNCCIHHHQPQVRRVGGGDIKTLRLTLICTHHQVRCCCCVHPGKVVCHRTSEVVQVLSAAPPTQRIVLLGPEAPFRAQRLPALSPTVGRSS